MNKRKVVLIDPIGGKAGMDFYDMALLSALSRKGFETVLFSNFECTDNHIKSFRTFNNIGINKVLAIFKNFFHFVKALVFCKKQKIQWLLLHLFRGGVFDLVTIGFARLLRIRVILIIHDVESLDSIALPLTRKIILTHFNHSKIVHNQFSYTALAGLISKKSMGNVHVIPHGNYISLAEKKGNENFSFPEFIPDKNCRYLLFFGQIKRVKGLDILLKALAESKSSYHLIIAGRERDDFYKTYKEQIDSLGLSSRIIPVIRFISDRERDALFRLCEAVVIPYKKVYQSGVLLMAMSYSKPVITSDIEPNQEIIKNGENGLLFGSGNSGLLAGCIDNFFFGKVDIHSIGYQGFKTVEKDHNWEEIAAGYSKILEA